MGTVLMRTHNTNAKAARAMARAAFALHFFLLRKHLIQLA